MSNQVLSVQELTTIIKGKFDAHINKFYSLEGEVQNLSDKGHCYFALKDKNAKTIIRCILWRGTKEKHGYSLSEGDIVILSGKIGLYEVQNSYSFSVFKMMKEETKETEFQRKFEMFKKKGYFNKKNVLDKKDINKVGLITSLQGQALHDFKKTLSNRFFYGQIFQYNVNVQGVRCAEDVSKAIKFFEKSKKYKVDVLLITRGGGSTIDMDEFNNERLIETVYKCKIPIYCAIGHEKDYCLMDYVCDLRSSTPTSLALEISEDYSEIHNKIKMIFESQKNLFERKKNDIMFNINDKKNKLYQALMGHRPNGFYFNQNFINNLGDFQKLCKEKFQIQLEDGIIEFKINDYKIAEKFNKKYTYSKYMEVYNKQHTGRLSATEDKNFSKYLSKFKKLENNNKFGTKEHYEIFEKLIKMMTYYINEFSNLDNVKVCKKNFELENLKEYNDLLQYKKHLNYLQRLVDNKFEGMKAMRTKDKDHREICKSYFTYNNNSVSEHLIAMYLGLLKIKVKYYKLKI